jgi:hypothetical protein
VDALDFLLEATSNVIFVQLQNNSLVCAPHKLWSQFLDINELHAGQVGDTLEEFLVEATSDIKLRQVLMSLSEAMRTIAFKVRMPPSACCTL